LNESVSKEDLEVYFNDISTKRTVIYDNLTTQTVIKNFRFEHNKNEQSINFYGTDNKSGLFIMDKRIVDVRYAGVQIILILTDRSKATIYWIGL